MSKRPSTVSDLPYAVLKRLADQLDLPNRGSQPYWRELIKILPDCPYDQITVEKFGMNANRVDGSPAYALLTDLSNRGMTYNDLVSLLKALKHYTALSDMGYTEKVQIVTHPRATPTVIGHNLELTCVATGVPMPTYMWFKERTPLPDQTSSKLIITNAQADNEGVYCCRATNPLNVVFSNWAEVRVQNQVVSRRPSHEISTLEILTQPQHQNILEGHSLYLVVAAEGPPPLTFQWYKDGCILPYGSSNELVIQFVQLQHQGTYMCSVTSGTGVSKLSSEAAVTVVKADNTPSSYAPTPAPVPLYTSDRVYPGMPSHPNHLPLFGPVTTPPPLYPTLLDSRLEDSFTVHTDMSQYSILIPPTDPHHLEEQDGPRGQDQSANLEEPCYDKVALLIGNKKYHKQKLRLNTPENDTQDLAAILNSADFKVVSLVNLNKQEMQTAIDYFLSLLSKNVYAFFFFAGHGFEINNNNYMMAVDAPMEKNPEFCICAQQVLDSMQSHGAKLSVMVLDMCRVASTNSNKFSTPVVAQKQHTGYYVYGFSCSPYEKAYERPPPTPDNIDSTSSIPESERENSIFVSAIKECFKQGKDINQPVDRLFQEAASGVQRRRMVGPDQPWQKPEIRSNLGHTLSLWDRCQALPGRIEKSSQLWKDAHTVPLPVVVGSDDGSLALRLHFEAEFSNVLVVTVELLNGCVLKAEVLAMQLELLQHSVNFPPLKSEEYTAPDSQFAYGHSEKRNKKDLIHMKISELQKLQQPPITLRISATYALWRGGEGIEQQSCLITHVLNPPPLYANIVATNPVLSPQSTYLTHF